MKNFQKADISLNVDGNDICFSIIHDMPNVLGLSIQDAVSSWIYRTSEFTAENLIEYIYSKDSGFTAMTEEEYVKTYNVKP